ncbi:MAG: chromosome segregation protein SMC [Burkholderiaceae bacterium]
MRLTQLRLSGFKSFVDPTNLTVSRQLVGIVGPNGCGKSNVIDAVRWVLGESKASELRGENMQDVIFNGSGSRKPAGRASVELIFDNSEGRLAGPWGRFGELSVKRVLTRDGQSSYYINTQHVRRKDVYDLFMGTGLGPRAYAIIGQGMISRVIESRPEELRVFLEEAAGVSKYRERRRETEGRLEDARENLSRVEDIRVELTQRIESLAAQAEVAERYQGLVSRKTERQTLLLALRRHESAVSLAQQRRHRDALLTQREALMAQAAAARHAVEASREAWELAQQQVQQAQTALFECNTRVARQEADDRSHRQALERAEASTAEAQASEAALLSQIAQNDQQQSDAQAALSGVSLELQQARESVATVTSQLLPLETASEEANQALSEARAVCSAAEAEERGLAARLLDAQQQHKRAQDRLAAVAEALRTLEVLDPSALGSILAQQSEAQALAQQSAEALTQAQAALSRAEQEVQTHRHEEAAARREADRLSSEHSAQQAILRRLESPGALGPWLERHKLAGKSVLWSGLKVESGWQQAVGAVLADRLSALPLDQIEDMQGLLQTLPPANQFFFSGQAPSVAELPNALGAKVSGPSDVVTVAKAWLVGARTADDIAQALSARNTLESGHFFVTREGHLVGPNWARLHGQSQNDGSSLLSQRDLVEDLKRQAHAAGIIRDEAIAALQSSEQRLEGLRRQLSTLREAEAKARARAHELELTAVRIQEKAERLRQRAQELETNRGALTTEVHAVEGRLAELQSARQASQEAQLQGKSNLEAAQSDAQRAQSAWAEGRQALARSQEVQKSLELHERSLQEQSARLKAERAALETRIEEARGRAQRAATDAAEARARLSESHLQALLDERVAREAELAAARDGADGVGQTVREQDETRLRLEREAMPLAEQSAQAEAAIAGAQATIEQIDQQVQDLGLEIGAVSAGWPAFEMPEQQPKPSTVSADVSRLTREIEALGPVNLAALQELEQARERQGFLAAQAGDLLSAVETLEDAIRKIDRESRALLQSTYDTVNANFSKLFPSLFGGGEARLVLTGDEILDAGVQVMAQPPGKKNSSIHLLSGGEKALTATALVFALFQLNPAPFCLLDEVDAPLDDPNTERLCRLVKEMSVATQFIFITHNKIAMELAEHLVGVTMQEQGVSRLVAVDLEAQAV